MLNFPAFCVDNFYEDPDAVRAFALENLADYSVNHGGRYPGKRTKSLHELSPQLFDKFNKKLFSLFYDLKKSEVNWRVDTSFQLIAPFSEDPQSPKNLGWIHVDGAMVFAGIVYLTPDIGTQTGTSIFRLDKPDTLDNSNVKYQFYEHGTDDGTYDAAILKHTASFTETARFHNIYNRLVGFDGASYHGVNSYHVPKDKEPRLTQVFFVHAVDTPSSSPIQRCKYY